MTAALLGLALIPAILAGVVVGLRAPMKTVLPFYAALVPFGSGIALPIGLPPPFNTLSTLAGLIAIAAIVAHLLLGGHSAPRLVPSIPVWLLFLALNGLTYLWSVDRQVTLDYLLVLVSLVALFLAVALMPASGDDARRLEDGVLAGAVAASAFGFYLLLTDQLPEKAAGIPRFATAGGADADPNITAAVLVLPLIVALSRIRSEVGWRRTGAVTAALLLSVGLVLTASRGGMVAAAVAIVVLVAHHGRPLRTAATTGVLALLVVAAGLLLAPDQVERLSRTGSTGRDDVWRVAQRACVTHCWSGSGLGTFPEVHSAVAQQTPDIFSYRLNVRAHNIWLGAAVETGFLSVALLAAALFLTVAPLLRMPAAVRGPPLAAMAGLLTSNMFLGNLSFKYFWLVLIYAVVVALSHTPLPAASREPAAAPLDAHV